ncbi:MAG: leucine-rich repeat protein [Ruthenibacterium sp.]
MATLNVRAENLSTLSCAVSLAVTEKPTYGLTFSSSSPVFYPAQDEQNPETRAITLRNAGNTTVTLAAPPEATYCTISGFTEGQSLESGKTLTFYVTPKTNLVPGTYQENIIIRGIAPDGGIATGTLTVEVRVSEANRNVTFSTSGLNFGYWQEGQTPQERGVEIRNNGNISLSLKVELDEAVEKGFTYELRAGTDATPPVLPAPQNYQDKRSLWLYLVPKAGLPAGDYSGNVTVKDAYSGAVLGTVSVSYFAQQAQIEVTGKDGTLLATASAGNNGAATLDFGEMPYGYTPAQYSQAVTVKNTGNVAVEVGYTGGSDWLASSDSLSSTLQPGATRTMTFTVPAGKGLGQQTREPGTASGGNIWVRMQNDVQAFARVYLGYTFTVTKPATWGEWLYDADAQTLTRLSDNLTLQNVTAGGTSLTIGKQYISQSTALDLTGAVTDADGTPYTITALGVEAFWGCGSYLTAITLPDGLESIGRCAFQSCASLTAIEIPSSVTSIGASAFNGCTSLAAVTLPEGL